MSPRIAIVADDFTGLQAIAGEFRRAGFSVRTCLDPADVFAISEADVVGIDTNSRAQSQPAAVTAVNEAANQLLALGVPHVYKQCDSGMQGHIASEAEALAASLSSRAIAYAPACPGLGRITRAARQIMIGSLCDQSPLDVDIPSLWQSQTGHVPQSTTVHALNNDNLSGTLVIDAETDQDLLQLASLCLKPYAAPPLMVGSVGFANAVALCLRLADGKSRPPALIVTGSLQAQTLAQLETLKSVQGCDIVELPMSKDDDALVEAAVRSAASCLAAGRNCLLASPHSAQPKGSRYPYISADALSDFNGSMVAVTRRVLMRPETTIAGVVVTGGMTSGFVAREVLEASVTIIEEWIAAGTTGAVAIDKRGRRTRFVTKAGTWGDGDTLLRSLLWLQRSHQSN